ncbi:DinB family protein [Virgibacillus doumboii]|uniref:DinB family protein n=1 Tax=Virgibacillus doumboii TaxID=2697503 RepID=UPI0013E00D4B|nr:DinB family protein [Virgibacillus doumboii]
MDINEQARKELLEEVNEISDEDLNRKPSEDKWSIKQVLEHLYLMEGAITKTIQGQLDNGQVANAEEKPIELTLNRAKKVEAPEFARPSESYATLGELKEKLKATHKRLVKLESTSDARLLSERGYPHPLFSDMSLKQWIPFVGYHEMRHTEQIKEIKSDLGIR